MVISVKIKYFNYFYVSKHRPIFDIKNQLNNLFHKQKYIFHSPLRRSDNGNRHVI